MANWSDLKAAVAKVIKTNGNQEITGQLLQNVLNNIISNLGANAAFAGIATPTTNPGTPDQNIFYLTSEPGVYANFANISVNMGELAILKWNGTWSEQTVKVGLPPNELNISTLYPTNGEGGTNKYSLTTAIAQVPSAYRKAGLKVSFVDESNNTHSWEYKGGSWIVDNFTEVGANKFSELSNDFSKKLEGVTGIVDTYEYMKGSTLNEETARKGTMSLVVGESGNYYVFKEGTSDVYWVTNHLKVKKGDVINLLSSVGTAGGNNPSIIFFFTDDVNKGFQKIKQDISTNFQYIAYSDGYIEMAITIVRNGQFVNVEIKRASVYASIKDYMLDLSVINPGNTSNSDLDTKHYYQIGNNVYLENNNAALGKATKVAALIGLTSADLGRLPDRLYLYADYYSIRDSCKLINGDNEYILSFNKDLNCYEINLSELDKSKDLFITLEATTNVSTDKILSIENIRLLPNPYNGGAFVKPYELEGVFGKNSYILTPDTTKNLQDVIDEIAIGGTLYITEGDYILPAESLKIKRPITIKGIGNVRFLGGKYIKDAMAVGGYDDVYSAQVNSDDAGYVYGKIWQDNIPYESIGDDGWDIYNNRTHRLPSTLLKNVSSVDAVKTSDEPCYFVNGSTMYFRTVPGSDLNQNPIVINRYDSTDYYPDNKDKLEVDFNAKDVNIDNIAVYYSMLAIRKSDSINITNTKVFFSNNQMCLAIAQQAMANIVFKNCEFAGGNGDGMHSNYHGIPINGLVDVRFYSCWFHDCNDGASSHSGANKPELRFYDCLFSHNSITGSAPVNAKELYVNCIFKKNGSARGGLRIVSVDGECDVTCINCMSIDNEGDAWSVQANSAKATLNLYGCKSILTDNSAGIGFVYQKTQNKAGYINAYGCSNNYPAEKQSKITGEGKINIVGEMLIAMTPSNLGKLE